VKRLNTPLIILLTATLALPACGKRESAAAGGESTETIAPASPQPAPTGTDAMTQTVDVEHGRSEAEGGGLTTAPDTTATTTTTTTGTVAYPPTTTTR
jgi:hypothetical protein